MIFRQKKSDAQQVLRFHRFYFAASEWSGAVLVSYRAGVEATIVCAFRPVSKSIFALVPCLWCRRSRRRSEMGANLKPRERKWAEDNDSTHDYFYVP